jgi:ABC-type multidrug transport system fused ATPase/permease subunit
LLGIGCYKASTAFHSQLISSILRAPMSFFDKTPLGRIMNRFSMDIEILDTELCQSYGYLFILLTEVVRQFMTIFAAMPVMTPVAIPLVIACVFVCVSFFN